MTKHALFVTAITPVGSFYGRISDKLDSVEQAKHARDYIQDNIANSNMLTLFDDEGDREITLNEDVITNSVFIFNVKQVE